MDNNILPFHSRQFISIISIIVVLGLFAAQLFAQHTMPRTENIQTTQNVKEVGVSKPPSTTSTDGQFAVLVDGLGTYGRRISTKSEVAQKFFDQGLRLIYGYYSPEATASFKEALRHDPDHPMLYWGLALALGPIPNSRFQAFPDDPKEEGRKAIAAARDHAAKGSSVEQALIETLGVRYDTDRSREFRVAAGAALGGAGAHRGNPAVRAAASREPGHRVGDVLCLPPQLGRDRWQLRFARHCADHPPAGVPDASGQPPPVPSS